MTTREIPNYQSCILELYDVCVKYDPTTYLTCLLRITAGVLAHVAIEDERAGWEGLGLCEKQLRNDFCELIEIMKKAKKASE